MTEQSRNRDRIRGRTPETPTGDADGTRPVSRRRVLAAAGVTGLTVGLAGCSGSGPDGSGGGSGGTPTPESDGSGGGGGGDSGGDGTPTAEPEFSCDAYAVSETVAYDLSGTPSLVTFDVPDGYGQAGRYPESERFVEEIKSPIVDFHQVFVLLDQRYEPYTSETVQEDIDEEVADRSSASAEFEPVDAIEFGGETVDLYGTQGFPADGAVHAAWLPHETSEGKRYFKTFFGLSTSSAFYEENEDGDPELTCLETLRSISDVVLSSLAPNPETTIEEQV